MRQVLSTAITALIVAALTAVSIGALAQSEPAPETERAITPAGLNADKVDGRHAVKYTNKKGRRRGKLVATNNQGELPSNIVKPFWTYLRGTPPGFADGVDNEGVTSIAVTTQSVAFNSLGVGGHIVDVPCPAGSKVVGGGWYDVNAPNNSGVVDSYPVNPTTWRLYIVVDAGTDTGTAYATCLTSAGVSIAGRLTPAAKNPSGDGR